MLTVLIGMGALRLDSPGLDQILFGAGVLQALYCDHLYAAPRLPQSHPRLRAEHS